MLMRFVFCLIFMLPDAAIFALLPDAAMLPPPLAMPDLISFTIFLHFFFFFFLATPSDDF